MTEARATWIDQHRFNAAATSDHSIIVDGDKATGNSPMELVLIGLCGCTGYDVANILQKKREPFTSLEVRAQAERAPDPPSVYTDIRHHVPGGREGVAKSRGGRRPLVGREVLLGLSHAAEDGQDQLRDRICGRVALAGNWESEIDRLKIVKRTS